jgi:hypothetical protein
MFATANWIERLWGRIEESGHVCENRSTTDGHSMGDLKASRGTTVLKLKSDPKSPVDDAVLRRSST